MDLINWTDIARNFTIVRFMFDYKNLIAEVMIKGLKRIPWERIDVSFRKTMQKIFAHSTIQVFPVIFFF